MKSIIGETQFFEGKLRVSQSPQRRKVKYSAASFRKKCPVPLFRGIALGFIPVIWAILSLGFLCLQGCYYDKEDKLYPNSNINCDLSVTTYSATVSGIINDNCVSCHKPGGTAATSGDFRTYAGLSQKINSGAFNDRVFVKKDMPQTGPLSNCDYQKLQKWVNNGAQNN